MSTFVILPAAGLGTRMGSHTASPKQFLELAGVPVLLHSIRAFAATGKIDELIVVIRASERPRIAEQIASAAGALRGKNALNLPIRVVDGGDTRQESVAHGLNALGARDAKDDDIVLVHDAARPLVDAAAILRTIEAVERYGAAIVGLPAVDTIKQVERTAEGAVVTSTIPRERIVQAQTPQGFRYGLLKRAFAEAEADGFVGTDEASLAERAGISVHVVMGSPRNIKITQPGDLELAEFYLRR